MRWQRNMHRGSRPKYITGEPLEPPRATRHTAESYRARYVRPGPNDSMNRLLRYARMARRESANASL
jgi:hypothetical protein